MSIEERHILYINGIEGMLFYEQLKNNTVRIVFKYYVARRYVWTLLSTKRGSSIVLAKKCIARLRFLTRESVKKREKRCAILTLE